MSNQREQDLEAYKAKAAGLMVRAGDSLARRQIGRGWARGGVAFTEGDNEADFHGTLSAIWLWSRAQLTAGEVRFGEQVGAAWGFVEKHWDGFIPSALSAAASDEAPYDCAMALRSCLATHALAGTGDWRRHGDAAARMLAGYLAEGHEAGGRGFLDPGFLVWNLSEYARTTSDRGLIASAGRFIDKAFGTGKLPPFSEEPPATGGLFDFSSTLATRILAVIASEGPTPFVGSWLRERVVAGLPEGFTARALDENSWNACVAAAAGSAYVVSTDDRFRQVHETIVDELNARADRTQGGLGRADGFPAETGATFYWGLALDSMVRV